MLGTLAARVPKTLFRLVLQVERIQSGQDSGPRVPKSVDFGALPIRLRLPWLVLGPRTASLGDELPHLLQFGKCAGKHGVGVESGGLEILSPLDRGAAS